MAATDHGARPQVLRKSTLVALSRAIEHELLARAAAPVLFGAFQRERFYRALEPRWRRMARHADAATVFADFAALRRPSGAPVEVPIAEGEALANEWAVIVDAPGYAACLLAWEQPGAIEPEGPDDRDRRFEAIWTIDPRATRRAAQAAARLAGNVDAGVRAPARGAAGRPPAGDGAAGAGAHRADQPPAGLRRGPALDELDDDLVAGQRGALAGGHDREAVGAEHRAELVRALRPGRRREAVVERHAHALVAIGMARDGRVEVARRSARARAGRPASPRARGARRA